MRQVVDNHMVRHLWANQAQPSARSHNGNHSFQGASLYSYSTEIARIVTNAHGRRGVMICTWRYSVTTGGKHMPRMSDIPAGVAVLYIPEFPRYGESEPLDLARAALPLHIAEYREAVKSAKRRRGFTAEGLYGWFGSTAEKATDLAEFFDLPMPEVLDVARDVREVMEHIAAREARASTPQAIAARERAAARKAEREAEARRLKIATLTERIEAWKAGANIPGFYARAERGGAYLRVKGDELQTSMGARVPLPDAIKAFRLIRLVMQLGEAWHRNGETMPVGQFQVDHITPDGTMRAGCHLMCWPEIEFAAKQAGVYP